MFPSNLFMHNNFSKLRMRILLAWVAILKLLNSNNVYSCLRTVVFCDSRTVWGFIYTFAFVFVLFMLSVLIGEFLDSQLGTGNYFTHLICIYCRWMWKSYKRWQVLFALAGRVAWEGFFLILFERRKCFCFHLNHLFLALKESPVQSWSDFKSV